MLKAYYGIIAFFMLYNVMMAVTNLLLLSAWPPKSTQ